MAADAASDATDAWLDLLDDVKTPETVIMNDCGPQAGAQAEEDPPPATQLKDSNVLHVYCFLLCCWTSQKVPDGAGIPRTDKMSCTL